MDKESISARLSELNDELFRLSPWERSFVVSVTKQSLSGRTLSKMQMEVIERIEKKISPEAIKQSQQWVENYNNEKKRVAKICAMYYLKAGYFMSLAKSIVSDPDFIPTEKAWKKMCCNKYAEKVLRETDSSPKYVTGSYVQFRAQAAGHLLRKYGNRLFVVLGSGESVGYVEKAAKGAKLYKILPFGGAQILKVEERDIKKAKKDTLKS